MEKETKFMIIFGIFIAALTILNVVSVKIVTLFGLTFSVGAFIYAITFPCTDIISECWGKNRAKKVVLIGFLANILVVSFILISISTPAAEFWEGNQAAFKTILGVVPRILLASMIAYLISQYHDVWAFHFWKNYTSGKYLWFRNNASTFTSQLIDSVIFVTIAFYGILPNSLLIPTIFGQFVIKLGIAVIDTPFVYLLVNWIKNSTH